MAKIEIEWLSDSVDCETCGGNWAEGAIVKVDGEVVLDLSPAAACCSAVSYSETEVWTKVLEHLGHEVEAGY